ncbi:MAG: L-histidine N(alpha)-methyltransferase [Burkholderiaceae bacterium]|nr:L-histidine N(alpha)-methyltransferase [Burkholderiaceae bacterium]
MRPEDCAATPAFLEIPARSDPRAELLAGLRAQPAAIAPKFLYDALGARLFEAICELPEYYLPRAEAEIYDRHGAQIARALAPQCTLIDLGAGNCEKARRLFEWLQPAQYVAVDISAQFLRERLSCLQERYPQLPMVGIAMDFSERLVLPPPVRRERRVFFYPGSSIGNFTPPQAVAFLSRVVREMDAQGALLIGVDLVKDEATLHAAYDDALGVTAAFNRNVLNHVNRLLGSDFDVRDWEHVAVFDARASRVEMHLQALRPVRVRLPDGERLFEAGERIHTENSYKYQLSAFTALLVQAGLCAPSVWLDRGERFAVFVAKAAAA